MEELPTLKISDVVGLYPLQIWEVPGQASDDPTAMVPVLVIDDAFGLSQSIVTEPVKPSADAKPGITNSMHISPNKP